MVLRLLAVFVLIHNVKCEMMHLTFEQVQQLVDGHNWLRQKIAWGNVTGQPPAAEMKMITWDYELANKSATWASRDQFGHNPDKTVPSKRFITGENIYSSSSTVSTKPLDVSDVLSAWWGEHNNFRFHPMQWSDISRAGHYTQMAWSDSIHLGCGVSKYYNGYYTYFVVCNYGPAGNWQGQTPYKAGPPSKQLICGTVDCSHPYGSCWQYEEL